MKRFVLIVAVAAAAASSAPAAAQQIRTFVSGHGADSGTCGVGSPCRTFAYAITQTGAGGEITVLDPAGYGAVAITKSASIINDGVGEAGVTVTTLGDAISVNAGVSDVVNLRGLTLVGNGVGASGISLLNANTLNVQNCVIRGFGIGMDLITGGSSQINVSDTIVSNNGNGIELFPTAANAVNNALFWRVQALANQVNGFAVGGNLASGGTIRAVAADSIAAGNGGTGFTLNPNGEAGNAAFNLANVQSVYNGTGLSAESSAYASGFAMVISQTNVFGNSVGYAMPFNFGIFTYGNNEIWDFNNTGTLSPKNQQ
jgi:hypothetical protein